VPLSLKQVRASRAALEVGKVRAEKWERYHQRRAEP